MFKNIKFEFKGETADNLNYRPNRFQDTFYQICQFKNEKTKMHITRKIIYNENYDIIKIFEKQYDSKKINKFLNSVNPNKVKIYPVYDIKIVGLPTSSELLNSHSELSNQKSSAKWNNIECHDLYNDMIYGGLPNSNTMASPGNDISKMTRKVGGDYVDKNIYLGEPTHDNLRLINNNLV
jgi:hypothetical protein